MTSKKENKNSNQAFKLSDLNSKASYKAPSGYFDRLNTQIINNIEAQAPKSDNKGKQKWWILAVAAAACILLFLMFPSILPTENSQDYLSEVSQDDIIAYLVTSDLQTDEIIAEISKEGYQTDVELQQFEVSEEESEMLLEYYTL